MVEGAWWSSCVDQEIRRKGPEQDTAPQGMPPGTFSKWVLLLTFLRLPLILLHCECIKGWAH